MSIHQSGNTKPPLALLSVLTVACTATPPPANPGPAVPPAPSAPVQVAETPTEQPIRLLEAAPEGVCADTNASTTLGSDDDDGGYLDPKVVRNVVQGGYFSMRACYEEGLARDTELTGKIQVRFVIERDGRVSSAHLDDNTLPDCEAARCMLEVYRGLEFPEPDGGRVTVVYPLTFTRS